MTARRHAIAWVAILVLFAGTRTGHAEDNPDPLDSGMRVRVTFRPSPPSGSRTNRRERLAGTLLRVDQATLTLSDRSEPPRVVPIDSIVGLDVSRGRKGQAGKGALIGLATGVAAGIVASSIVCSGGDCRQSGGDYTGLSRVVFAVGGGLFGAGAGALIGGRLKTDRWEPVSLVSLGKRLERDEP